MTEERVTQVIKDIDKGDTSEYHFYKMCPALLSSICDYNNWTFEMDDDYNSWEVDWCGEIKTQNATISVDGSMYYGTINLKKK
jgi:hypothetical protein